MRNEVLCFKVSSDNLDMYFFFFEKGLNFDLIFYYYTMEKETFKTSQSVK